jgi:hypothetical protein
MLRVLLLIATSIVYMLLAMCSLLWRLFTLTLFNLKCLPKERTNCSKDINNTCISFLLQQDLTMFDTQFYITIKSKIGIIIVIKDIYFKLIPTCRVGFTIIKGNRYWTNYRHSKLSLNWSQIKSLLQKHVLTFQVHN